MVSSMYINLSNLFLMFTVIEGFFFEKNLFSEFRVKFEKTLSEQMIFLEIGSTTKLNLY